MNDYTRSQALASYLIALALLEQSGNIYVRREISKALDEIQHELGLKK